MKEKQLNIFEKMEEKEKMINDFKRNYEMKYWIKFGYGAYIQELLLLTRKFLWKEIFLHTLDYKFNYEELEDFLNKYGKLISFCEEYKREKQKEVDKEKIEEKYIWEEENYFIKKKKIIKNDVFQNERDWIYLQKNEAVFKEKEVKDFETSEIFEKFQCKYQQKNGLYKISTNLNWNNWGRFVFYNPTDERFHKYWMNISKKRALEILGIKEESITEKNEIKKIPLISMEQILEKIEE